MDIKVKHQRKGARQGPTRGCRCMGVGEQGAVRAWVWVSLWKTKKVQERHRLPQETRVW